MQLDAASRAGSNDGVACSSPDSGAIGRGATPLRPGRQMDMDGRAAGLGLALFDMKEGSVRLT